MGTSTDAKLAWGVDLGEGIPRWLCDDFGVAPATDDDDGASMSALVDALNKAGLDIEHHCSDACTMYVLCVEESATTAWRGHPKPIASLDVPPAWRDRWARVARAGEPTWLLFSWWG